MTAAQNEKRPDIPGAELRHGSIPIKSSVPRGNSIPIIGATPPTNGDALNDWMVFPSDPNMRHRRYLQRLRDGGATFSGGRFSEHDLESFYLISPLMLIASESKAIKKAMLAASVVVTSCIEGLSLEAAQKRVKNFKIHALNASDSSHRKYRLEFEPVLPYWCALFNQTLRLPGSPFPPLTFEAGTSAFDYFEQFMRTHRDAAGRLVFDKAVIRIE